MKRDEKSKLEAKIRRLEKKVSELSKFKDFLAQAQRITGVGSWEWDIENNLVWWSDEVYLIYGLKPKNFVATYEGFLKLVHPEDLEHVDRHVRLCLRNKRSVEFRHRLIRPGGELSIAAPGRL